MSNQDKRNTRTRSRYRRSAIVAALVAAIPGLFWIGAGAYDVSVTKPHSGPIEWVLEAAVERSIREHAKDVAIPEATDLTDPALAARAIGHYSVACATCHGAPGHAAAPWMVLYPQPSDLTDETVVARWSDSELYWIVKNGIKDTGMIALGPTHQESDLWAVSAFVRQLPQMSGERYHELVTQYQTQRSQAAAPAHGH
jgi:mono/diheme cytochrome c family protein